MLYKLKRLVVVNLSRRHRNKLCKTIFPPLYYFEKPPWICLNTKLLIEKLVISDFFLQLRSKFFIDFRQKNLHICSHGKHFSLKTIVTHLISSDSSESEVAQSCLTLQPHGL